MMTASNALTYRHSLFPAAQPAGLQQRQAETKTHCFACGGAGGKGWARANCAAHASHGGKFKLQIRRAEGPITFRVGDVEAKETVPQWVTGTITPGLNLTAGGG